MKKIIKQNLVSFCQQIRHVRNMFQVNKGQYSEIANSEIAPYTLMKVEKIFSNNKNETRKHSIALLFKILQKIPNKQLGKE